MTAGKHTVSLWGLSACMDTAIHPNVEAMQERVNCPEHTHRLLLL